MYPSSSIKVLVTCLRFFILLRWPPGVVFATGDLSFRGEGSDWLALAGDFLGDLRAEGVGLCSAGSSLISGGGGGGDGIGGSVSISDAGKKTKQNMLQVTTSIRQL